MAMTKVEMAELAREIARAQLTAADELIDEVSGTWPDDIRGRLPVFGAVSQSQRFEAFRRLKPVAEREIQAREAQEAANAVKRAEARAEAEAYLAAEKARDELNHAAAVAKWNAAAAAAKAKGDPTPPKPAPMPTDEDRMARAQKAALHEVF